MTFVQNIVFKAPITKYHSGVNIWGLCVIDKFNKMNTEI